MASATSSPSPAGTAAINGSTALPRVTIQFCTQCKWMLRAAYFAQELLSTFGNSLGEVALQPSTGGTFIVKLYHGQQVENTTENNDEDGEAKVQEYLLWDRKAEGGFLETKELKKRVRDVIDPKRDLGHVDGKKKSTNTTQEQEAQTSTPGIEGMVLTPKAINHLRGDEGRVGSGERKFTPMDIDPDSRRTSGVGEQKKDENACVPGADCEDCA